MINKIFLDSNILIYLYTTDEIKKTQEIQILLKKYTHIYISTQVLFEFSYVMQRKFKCDYADIKMALDEFNRAFKIVLITYNTILHALTIAAHYKYSFPDSLIIATALESECRILFSEDMHNNQIIENTLTIMRPF